MHRNNFSSPLVSRSETRGYNTGMNIQTEALLKAILRADETVDRSLIENAMKILHGISIGEVNPDQVLRFDEAAKLLAVTRRTITNYMERGLLTPVYGGGVKKALGISMESYNKFILERSEYRAVKISELNRVREAIAKEKSKAKALAREHKKRKIRKLIRAASFESKAQLYEAIRKLVDSSEEYSANLVCEALGIPNSTYNLYCARHYEPWAAQRKKEEVVMQVISANYPNKTEPIGLREAHRLIQDHGIALAIETLARLLDANGYIREKKGSSHEQ